MQNEKRISKTELRHQAHQVIQEAQNGRIIVVENRGKAEAVMMSIIDLHLQRAVLHYFGFPKEYDTNIEVTEFALKILANDQERFNQVIGHYLAGRISIGRVAELLQMGLTEIKVRLGQTGVPVRMG